MKVKEIRIIGEDLLSMERDVVVQDVNCQGGIDSPLFNDIENLYPVVAEKFSKVCEKNPPEQLIGSVQMSEVPQISPLVTKKYIANIFCRANGTGVDINAFLAGMSSIHDIVKDYDMSVAIPFGIGEEKWGEIYHQLCLMFNDYDNIVVCM